MAKQILNSEKKGTYKVVKGLPHVKFKSNYDKDFGKGAWDKEYAKKYPGKPIPKLSGKKK